MEANEIGVDLEPDSSAVTRELVWTLTGGQGYSSLDDRRRAQSTA